MSWALEGVEQLVNVVVCEPSGQAELSRRHDEGLAIGVFRSRESKAEKIINGFLEGRAGTPSFLFQEAGYVVIQS
jgi:hypothetical protein